GNSFLHMLPEAVARSGFGVRTSATVLAGIVVFFLFEKLLLWRHEHGDGTHDHEHATKPYAFTTVFGDALHNFIDGAVIASACAQSAQLGMATTLAVILHEGPQELGDFGILLKGGVPPGRALVVNFLSGLVAFAGGI